MNIDSIKNENFSENNNELALLDFQENKNIIQNGNSVYTELCTQAKHFDFKEKDKMVLLTFLRKYLCL